ncbi:hypothetical protein QJS66_11750 [Kocuria rhizophila]|nr:hypothetical protein QJS66_11750 [Kocuria rhizophila]
MLTRTSRRAPEHPARFRRRDAAQPLPAGGRRAVRHARELYPGRIDLGLGRAPGTDPRTLQGRCAALPSRGRELPGRRELQGFLRQSR